MPFHNCPSKCHSNQLSFFNYIFACEKYYVIQQLPRSFFQKPLALRIWHGLWNYYLMYILLVLSITYKEIIDFFGSSKATFKTRNEKFREGRGNAKQLKQGMGKTGIFKGNNGKAVTLKHEMQKRWIFKHALLRFLNSRFQAKGQFKPGIFCKGYEQRFTRQLPWSFIKRIARTFLSKWDMSGTLNQN